ncbi:biopolymer transporter ExbD [Piscinibacter gummiphilus]|uniref:Biopolymer transporter ExbD n=1 Tax=Piscinibacter gummiphilus TaxID=946333 RepID=A0ABZ0CU99_9BURK|nr:biopolymer transporter ExbD [Piscinibacter gummiphilus]WOB08537.1 biopolymer transporter ExbD [Piscinibacter gummiphilus]
MAFASFDNRSAGAPMAEINMVPLIDVMLVLLVIFIVTAPLLTQAVKLELPKASSQPNVTQADKIEFGIDANGGLFWNGEPVERAEAARRFAVESQRQPQPEVHLKADQAVAYRVVAQTLADASKAGLTKVGFISEPEQP